MLESLDILFIKDGTYLWKASAANVEAAKSKIEQLDPGDYVIFDQATGKKTVVIKSIA